MALPPGVRRERPPRRWPGKRGLQRREADTGGKGCVHLWLPLRLPIFPHYRGPPAACAPSEIDRGAGFDIPAILGRASPSPGLLCNLTLPNAHNGPCGPRRKGNFLSVKGHEPSIDLFATRSYRVTCAPWASTGTAIPPRSTHLSLLTPPLPDTGAGAAGFQSGERKPSFVAAAGRNHSSSIEGDTSCR